MAQMIWDNFWFNAIWHTKSTATRLVLEISRQSCHSHTISHMNGVITLVI